MQLIESGFSQLVDSFYGYFYKGDDFVSLSMDLHFDYKIICRSDLSELRINDFTYKKRSCNNCPVEGESDKYDVLISYKVNGVIKSGGQIEIP